MIFYYSVSKRCMLIFLFLKRWVQIFIIFNIWDSHCLWGQLVLNFWCITWTLLNSLNQIWRRVIFFFNLFGCSYWWSKFLINIWLFIIKQRFWLKWNLSSSIILIKHLELDKVWWWLVFIYLYSREIGLWNQLIIILEKAWPPP